MIEFTEIVTGSWEQCEEWHDMYFCVCFLYVGLLCCLVNVCLSSLALASFGVGSLAALLENCKVRRLPPLLCWPAPETHIHIHIHITFTYHCSHHLVSTLHVPVPSFVHCHWGYCHISFTLSNPSLPAALPQPCPCLPYPPIHSLPYSIIYLHLHYAI